MKSENQNIVRNIVGPSFRSPLPFRPDWTIGHLPFSLRVLAGSERIKSSSLRAIIKKLAKFWFELWHVRLKFPASGTLYLGHNGEQKSLTFDGRNTHFASLYQANSEIGYEGEIVALLGAILPNNGIFFDIGSNFGYFALSIAARSGFTGKVHAFEPNEQAFSDLIHLTSQASLDKIVECHQLGLSNKDAEGRLRLDSTHSALSRISADENGEIISLKKLDSLELSTPDLLKIDVEGYEIEVLEGASETISQHQPAIIFENLRDTPLGKSFEPIFFFKNKGYQFFIPAWYMIDDWNWYFDSDPTALSISEDRFRLGVIPYRHHLRFLIRDTLNVLAWHEDRLDELNAIFDLTAGEKIS